MRRAVDRGSLLLWGCAAALLALFVHSFMGDGSWATFAERFRQNFVEDERWRMITSGLAATLEMTIASLLIGLAVGLAIAVVREAARETRASSPLRLLSGLADMYIAILRGTPVMVQLLIWNFTIFANVRDLDPLHVAMLAFGLNSSAYVAEIFRGGIGSIDRGQMEAARSLGLPYGKAMRLVILPQALRNIIPMLFNEFVTLLKETSIAGYIGVDDLTRAGQNIQALTMEHSQPLIAIALIYLAMVAVLTKLIGMLERRLKIGGAAS